MPPRILVDDRAGSKELVKYQPLKDCGELCRLDSGDVCFPGYGPTGEVLVGVEVKTASDLASSIATGRLQATQIPRMERDYDVLWLLITDEYQPGPRSGGIQLPRGPDAKALKLGDKGIPYAGVEGFLMTLVATGVHIKQVGSVQEAAFWLGVLASWWSKPWEGHKGLRTFDSSRTPSDAHLRTLLPGLDHEVAFRARLAAQLPGVGFERAVRAATHFESADAMMTASIGGWTEVAGIGPVIAEAIRAAMKR